MTDILLRILGVAVERVIHKRLWELLLNKTEKLNEEGLKKIREATNGK